MKPKIINLFAGPGTGKSTTAAALFAELKYRGINCELIPEYAKDAAWEGGRGKLFARQDYIFGKQHWRIAKVAPEVDVLVTDCPLLMGLVYSENYEVSSLKSVIRETHDLYDNLNVFLHRSKPYNPKGRLQTEEGAKELDTSIFTMLNDQRVPFYMTTFGRENPEQIISWMIMNGWDQDMPKLRID